MSKDKLNLLEEKFKEVENKFTESFKRCELELTMYNLNNYFKNNITPQNVQEQKLLKLMKHIEKLRIDIKHSENNLNDLIYRFGKDTSSDSLADEISNSFKGISNKYLDYVWGKQKLSMELLDYTGYDGVK